MFELASRLKLRFATVRGLITAEDLWDLPLTAKSGFSLDYIARAVNAELKESNEESFVATPSTGDKAMELRLDILKAVIKHRQDEAEATRTRVEKKARKDKIASILAQKKDDVLGSQSVEELEKLLAED